MGGGTTDLCQLILVLLPLIHPTTGLLAFAVANKPVCEIVSQIAPPVIKFEAARIKARHDNGNSRPVSAFPGFAQRKVVPVKRAARHMSRMRSAAR